MIAMSQRIRNPQMEFPSMGTVWQGAIRAIWCCPYLADERKRTRFGPVMGPIIAPKRNGPSAGKHAKAVGGCMIAPGAPAPTLTRLTGRLQPVPKGAVGKFAHRHFLLHG